MKKILSLAVAFLLCGTVFAGSKSKANKDTEKFRYDIECAGNGAQGTYLVKVWSYSKKADVAAEQCKKNAVHGVIFKGFSAQSGCVAQRALAANSGVELEYQDYFTLFFKDGGEYLKYVSATATPPEVIKQGREYRVGVELTVQKDALRKALEEAGVIRGLNFGF